MAKEATVIQERILLDDNHIISTAATTAINTEDDGDDVTFHNIYL